MPDHTSHDAFVAAGFPPADVISDFLHPQLAAANVELMQVSLRREAGEYVLEVCIDNDTEAGLSLDEVVELTDVVSAALDSHDLGESPYYLEVTTPGIDRPLQHPRHWRRNRGSLVNITTVTGECLRGRIGPTKGNKVVLVIPPVTKKGQPINARKIRVIELSFSDIVEAVIEFEFSEPSGEDWKLARDDERIAALAHPEGN